MYFPGEIMRGDHLKENEIKDNNDKINNDFLCSTSVLDKVQERIISQTAMLKCLKNRNIELEEWEKNCEDLDGWDLDN